MAGAPDTYNSDFVLASAAIHITDTPALPAPTAHSVTSFSAAGPSTRREKATGPWKNPGRTTLPYPHVQRSRDLMSRLGVTPTIQTSKEFEGIASLEEVTDEKTGARGKRGACDAWTEQVREPHLNNTHTHTFKKTLTHFHSLYVRGASSSGFSRY